MATAAPKRMIVAEFLEWDGGTDTRYEPIVGRVVAMAPPVARHGTRLIKLGRHLANCLTPSRRPIRPPAFPVWLWVMGIIALLAANPGT